MAIDEKFKGIMKSNQGCAVIMMGSGSDDKPKKGQEEKGSHIEQIAKSLEEFGVPYEVRVISAHKQPERLKAAIEEYNQTGGLVAYVAVAGGTDALSGTLSFHAYGPVISCPPDAPNETCLKNPPGSPNAYVARPENIGKLVAQMFAGVNQGYKGALRQANEKKTASLEREDLEIKKKYAQRREK